MNTIACFTQFNITSTGVANRRAPASLTGDALQQWDTRRRQQANFDTLVQTISLRCQPENITKPQRHDHPTMGDCWRFTFEVPSLSVYEHDSDQLHYLRQDALGVPMIPNLGEHTTDSSTKPTNTLFEVVQ